MRPVLLTLSLLLSGCGLSHPPLTVSQLITKQLGSDPEYTTACGPIAVSDTLGFFGIDSDWTATSNMMQRTSPGGNMARGLMSLFNWQLLSVTFPDEIIAALERNGLSVEVIRGHPVALEALIAQLSKGGGAGIVLMHKRGNPFDMHYAHFSEGVDPYYYKAHSRVMAVYIVTRLE